MWAWYPCFLPSSGKTSVTLLSLMWSSHLIWSYYCPSTWKTWYLPSPSSALLSSQMTSASVLGVPKITILIAMISYSKKITKQAWQRVKLNRQNWEKTRVKLSRGDFERSHTNVLHPPQQWVVTMCRMLFVYQGSSLETPFPGLWFGAGYEGTLGLAQTKIPDSQK